MDYRGFDIPDAFVVGYGLDYNDEYRHLPYIAVLSDDEPVVTRNTKSIPPMQATNHSLCHSQSGIQRRGPATESVGGGLPRESFRVRVAVLGTETPWVESLRGEGVEVEVLGWRRPFDVLPFLALRRLIKSMRPDVVHVWGATALRASC